MTIVRVILKVLVVLPLLLAAVVEGRLRRWLGLMSPGPEGAVWVHHWCRRIVWALGIETEMTGPVPDAGEGMLAVVSNHLSYLDVLLYSAARPFVMVSKVEVRGWPVIGWITAQAGTIYVQRRDVKGGQTQTHAEVNAMMAKAYRSGLPVVFFPEGTTTDGSEILEFRRGLYNSAVYDQVPVKVAAIGYEFTQSNPRATIGEDVCFVGEADFGPHLLGLLGLRGLKAKIRWGDEVVPGEDRFQLARNSRSMTVELYNGLGTTSVAGQQVATVESAEDVFDRPVDGLGAIYGDGGASR